MDIVCAVTNQNTERIIYRNYKCSQKQTLADGRISGVCTKNCNSQIKTVNAVSVMLEETGHNHDEMSKREVQSITVKGNCKRKASQDMTSQPKKITRQDLVSIENVTSSDFSEGRNLLESRIVPDNCIKIISFL